MDIFGRKFIAGKLPSVDPHDLLTPERLDILARLDFAEAVAENRNSSWANFLYREALAMTNPYLHLGEDGRKYSLRDYESSFRALIQSLISQGFNSKISTIPVSSRGVINGAHRVAASLALEIETTIEYSDEMQANQYSFAGLQQSGLSRDVLEYLAWRYIQKKPNSRALLFTNISERDFQRALSLLRKQIASPEIFFGEISLSEIGKRRLLQLAYGHLDWWDDSKIEILVAERYLGEQKKNFLIVIETNVEGEALDIKLKLRKALFDHIDFDRQIHGTDDHFETMRLAEALLNRNSRIFLNHAPLGAENNLWSKLHEVGVSPEYEKNTKWCIDGSAVLEMFGIREAADIDYIAWPESHVGILGMDLHNAIYKKSSLNPEEIIFDPTKHFRYMGIKFVSLGVISAHGIWKQDPKSLIDLSKIGNFFRNVSPVYLKPPAKSKTYLWRARIWVGRKIEEKMLSRLPRKFAVPTRKAFRFLGSIFWR